MSGSSSTTSTTVELVLRLGEARVSSPEDAADRIFHQCGDRGARNQPLEGHEAGPLQNRQSLPTLSLTRCAEEAAGVMGQRERVAQATPWTLPGSPPARAEGSLRPVDARLLATWGWSELPPGHGLAGELLEAAGFHPRPGGGRLGARRRWPCARASAPGGRRAAGVDAGPGEGAEEADAAGGCATWRWPRMISRGALANVRSYAALLLSGRIPLEPKAQRGLETILRNADRALAFAQDFFDSSRAELGSLRLRAGAAGARAPARRGRGAPAGGGEGGRAWRWRWTRPMPPLPRWTSTAAASSTPCEAFMPHQLRAGPARGAASTCARVPVDAGIRVEVRRDGPAAVRRGRRAASSSARSAPSGRRSWRIRCACTWPVRRWRCTGAGRRGDGRRRDHPLPHPARAGFRGSCSSAAAQP